MKPKICNLSWMHFLLKLVQEVVEEVEQVLMLSNIVKFLEVEVTVLYGVSLLINHRDKNCRICNTLEAEGDIFMMIISIIFLQVGLDISR